MILLAKSVGALPNKVTVACPRCHQPYVLSYTNDEWHRVKDWIGLAERTLREDHQLNSSRFRVLFPAKVSSPRSPFST